MVVSDHLVGRVDELRLLERLLDDLQRGRSGVVVLEGEPGIGKTRLLSELIALADGRGHLVLSGSASELEHDLPFSVFVDAVDEYVGSLEPSRLLLDELVQGELAYVFPSLSAFARGHLVALQQERYRTHRAVRALLERLAAPVPLVLVLDDIHWADSASVELLGALLRRPPAGAILLALAMRPRQTPHRLSATLERALRQGSLVRIELAALSAAEARALLGEALDAAQTAALYQESGGNPFYLEQLARALEPAVEPASAVVGLGLAIEVPSAVAVALTEELASLSDTTRLLLEGAAVAGDPFEPELAAAAAGMSEDSALDALDELLRLDVIRQTDMPRRFRFRHPLLRRAVYEIIPGGWRLGAHQRCAAALAARGAAAAARAHHVERSAREGDLAAVAILREAGEDSLRLAPATAARRFAEALRLLPQTAPTEDRMELQLARAGALTAAGFFVDSHRVLLDALSTMPNDSLELGARLVRACVVVESNLGLHEQAAARLRDALRDLTNPDSHDAVTLRIELAMNGLWRAKYGLMQVAAEEAANAARRVGDKSLMAAALAVLALADSTMGAAERAQSEISEAAGLVDSLSDHTLAGRLDAAAWVAGAELYLDRYVEADVHAHRALALGRTTGQGELFQVLVQILGRVWFVRGNLVEAAELLDGGIEAERLLGNTQALAWNLLNRSVVALASGDLETALTTAQESVDLSDELEDGFHSAWAAVRLAGAFLELGRPKLAVDLILDSAGGEELLLIPGSWRAYCLELLTRCWLALGRHIEARRAANCAVAWASTVQLPMAAAWADRAAAEVDLEDGHPGRAAEKALASAVAAHQIGAPLESALSRSLAGRALVRTGQGERGAAELQHTVAIFDSSGALRYRDQAEYELRKLGYHIHRRTRRGETGSFGMESLTERELQVTRLVVDRKTNREIGAELFISQKTVETHLRNIFNKMNVSSRVELARAVEHAELLIPTVS